jgi:signal transduction histidine kinase
MAAAESAVGSWDAYRIEQVLVNLLTNAIRYAPGKPLEVSVFAADGSAGFAVRDRGRGIPAADQERIFQRFERLVSPNDVSGLGLGLYIAREIVIAHGGTIRVESEPGQGARFVVELPREGA